MIPPHIGIVGEDPQDADDADICEDCGGDLEDDGYCDFCGDDFAEDDDDLIDLLDDADFIRRNTPGDDT